MNRFADSKILVALLDDHAIVRYGLATRLGVENDFKITGVYDNAIGLIFGLRANPVDIVVMDFSLGPNDIDGISLIKTVQIKSPKSKIIVISSHCDPATVASALRVGAHGFVGKDQGLSEIVKAIRKVASGATYVNLEMSNKLKDMSISQSKLQRNEESNFSGLSIREREVIRCYLDGLTVSEIAKKFGRSAKTISTQKSSAYRKLGVTSDNGLFKIKNLLINL